LIVEAMEKITTIVAVLIGLMLLNVWIIRINRPTNFRGGDAKTMREEFRLYGLPDWVFPLVGGVKIVVALLFLGSSWLPEFVQPAAIVLSILMLCAAGMHFWVSDPLRKAVPALCLFGLSMVLAVV
jgi:hypothetical protein